MHFLVDTAHPTNRTRLSFFSSAALELTALATLKRCFTGTYLRSVRANVAAVDSKKPAAQGPIIVNGQVLHSIEPRRLDVIHSLEKDGWVERELPQLLHPVDKCWQPADFLPDGADEDFVDKACSPPHDSLV
jgi:hypothetical protein